MTPLKMLGEPEYPIINAVVDVVVAARGQPWRVAFEKLERMPHGTAAQRARIVGAVRRVLGRSAAMRVTARDARGLVLGHPALDAGMRAERLATAGVALGLTATQVETAMWGDLTMERAVELPDGRPSERTLAALANLDAIQHALRSARHVRLRVWDDPRELWRAASVRGLLAAATPELDGSTTFDIRGPLALFHQTAVYARALGALVPLLAEQARFDLVIEHDDKTLRVAPPLLLPLAPPLRRPPMALDARLARDLEAPDWTVTREPDPIPSGDRLLFPHLRLDGKATWFVEIIGFATEEFLADKHARYQAANIDNIIFCIDADRASAQDISPARTIWFHKRVPADAILEMIR